MYKSSQLKNKIRPLQKAIQKAGTVLKTFFSACLFHWRITLAIITAIVIFILGFVAARMWFGEKEEPKRTIVLEDTPIEIEKIMPKGELYVGTSVIEDYTTLQRTERHLGIIKQEHSCVQILRQKCSYVVILDSIEYTHLEGNKVLVHLPELKYVATTQKSPFMSDDESFWAEALPSTNAMKKKVASQIRSRFDTKDNRYKAQRYAENSVTILLHKLGYEAEFTTDIERKRE